MGKHKPEIQRVLDALVSLSTEHNLCCLRMGKLFNQIQEKFERARETALSDEETKSLKGHAAEESSICYRMGVKYNELSRLLGEQEAEALIRDDPKLSSTEVVLFGKVAENFSETQAVAHGIDKMVRLVEYAALNGMRLRGTDPEVIEISLLQQSGRWKKRRFRDCSADAIEQVVIVIKAQRGISVDDPWDSIDLHFALD